MSYLLLLYLILFFAACVVFLALTYKGGIVAPVSGKDSPLYLTDRGAEPAIGGTKPSTRSKESGNPETERTFANLSKDTLGQRTI